ncbi:MAG: hypothetical protein ACLP9L_32855 [Thermoguttaceae bacterium]
MSDYQFAQMVLSMDEFKSRNPTEQDLYSICWGCCRDLPAIKRLIGVIRHEANWPLEREQIRRKYGC